MAAPLGWRRRNHAGHLAAPGDVVATNDGLDAFSGVRFGASQTADFTRVASFPGLTTDVRARLGEMKVRPMTAEMVSEAQLPDTRGDVAAPVSVVPKTVAPKAKQAD